ncbi:MAG: hypothetical protein ACLQGP_36785 [Isosphaeraceae bacterium]
MFDDETLLPPLPVIQERLTRNQREEKRLRTLLRLAIEAKDDRRRGAGKPEQLAASRGVMA